MSKNEVKIYPQADSVKECVSLWNGLTEGERASKKGTDNIKAGYKAKQCEYTLNELSFTYNPSTGVIAAST